MYISMFYIYFNIMLFQFTDKIFKVDAMIKEMQ